ncbi:alpha/beta hydrolase family protein [uncultured Alistipes sp.]|uniref:alpha/beta hydrolase n=1 Tax=uncultured Alistipes sp. TaxID=538949 RepID=UPI0025E1046D|nr:alpha/beta hydrolase family protein [uncultured Alistipes sp.]
MKPVRKFLLLLALFAYGFMHAASVDTLLVRSVSMDREVPAIVIVPDGAVPDKSCPVIYLLHGYGGNEFSWLRIKPSLPAIADREGVVFVCPGVGNCWYLDSKVREKSLYETFMIRELLPAVEQRYPVSRDRAGRAITGLSMGGFGAMSLAIKHKELFGAVGSTSGGLDIRPFPGNWELPRLLGQQETAPEAWERVTPVNLIPLIAEGDLAMVIDCGYDDFFFGVNNEFHAELLRRGIPHDYYVRPGRHNNAYWSVSIDYQIVFFTNFFAKTR